ncbi:MAG: hypothetical protein V4671_08460 [Armatimonadota bacterium]
MPDKSTQQMWADLPAELTQLRDSYLQNVEIGMRQNRHVDGVPLTPEDFGFDEVERLSWFLPLAEILRNRAAESGPLSHHAGCYDKYALCLIPKQRSSSNYWVMCSAVGPDAFQVRAVWSDYLRKDSKGKREVVKAGTSLSFQGNAEDTADYLVQTTESWEASGPPLP